MSNFIHSHRIERVLNDEELAKRLQPMFPLFNDAYARLRGRRHLAPRPVTQVVGNTAGITFVCSS